MTRIGMRRRAACRPAVLASRTPKKTASPYMNSWIRRYAAKIESNSCKLTEAKDWISSQENIVKICIRR